MFDKLKHQQQDFDTVLAMTQNNEYSVIISDINMPKLNGIDFLQALRDNADFTPFIIITGHGDLPHAVKALRLGAIDFINKPFEMEHVFNSVSSGLEVGVKILKFRELIKAKKGAENLSKDDVEKLIKLNLSIANLSGRKIG